jgi:hypothetical protein
MRTLFFVLLLSIAAVTGVGPANAQSTLPKEGVVGFSSVLHLVAQHRIPRIWRHWCSPGARSIGYGLWLLRLQPFEDGLQRLGLRR